MKAPRPDRLNTRQAFEYLRDRYGYDGSRRTIARRMDDGSIESWREHPRKKHSWRYTTASALDEYAEKVGWSLVSNVK